MGENNLELEERVVRMLPQLNEKKKRLFLANEAMSHGYGGVSLLSQISGVSRTTITKGIAELKSGSQPKDRVRSVGGGPNFVEDKYPELEEAIMLIGKLFEVAIVKINEAKNHVKVRLIAEIDVKSHIN